MDNTEFETYGQKIVDTRNNLLHAVEFLVRRKNHELLDLDNWFSNLDVYESVRWTSHQIHEAVKFYDATNVMPCVNIDNDVLAKMNTLYINAMTGNKLVELEMTQVRKLASFDSIYEFESHINDANYKKNLRVSLDDYIIDDPKNKETLEIFCQIFNTIKLDKSNLINIEDKLVQDSLQNFYNDITSFGVRHIVEGVETQQQLEILERIGFHVFQGYYFHKPEPLDSLTKELMIA